MAILVSGWGNSEYLVLRNRYVINCFHKLETQHFCLVHTLSCWQNLTSSPLSQLWYLQYFNVMRNMMMINEWFLFCLCWGLTSQSTIFQSCRDGAIASWVINQYFRGVKCLAQGHSTAAVGFEPPTSRSGVRHSTTEPPRSPQWVIQALHSLQEHPMLIPQSLRKAQKYTSSHKSNCFKIYILENIVSIFIPLCLAFYRTTLKKERKDRKCQKQKNAPSRIRTGDLLVTSLHFTTGLMHTLMNPYWFKE